MLLEKQLLLVNQLAEVSFKGKHGPVLILRHGARYIDAHVSSVQLTNPTEIENITQEKSNETTEEQNNVNNYKETKETELSMDENNDDDNDNTTLDNSTRSSNNDIKLPSSTLTVKPNQSKH